MREEFDYFCIFDAFAQRPWVEKVRDKSYTTRMIFPCAGVGVCLSYSLA